MGSTQLVGLDLNRREQEKFNRMSAVISSAFVTAGYKDVETCEASGKGSQRRVIFVRRSLCSPLATLLSDEFIASTIDELVALIARRIHPESQ